MAGILSNKPVPEIFRTQYEQLPEGFALFNVVGDLTLKRKYGESMLTFGKEGVVAFDEGYEGGKLYVAYEDIEEAEVKRMYGNAVFFAKMKSGERKRLIRFTYASANPADAGADFINSVINDGYSDELIYAVENNFMRLRAFCPKCGRKLPSPDAECLNCKGKGKMISKFAQYALPYKKGLIICMLLSVFTTSAALVPPYITGRMVDTVLPQKDMNGLIKAIILLLVVYILQYSVTALRSYMLRITGDKIVIGLKKDIYEKAQYLPMSFYDKTSTGSVINRINSDTSAIQNFVMKISQEAIVQLFTLVGILVIMLALNWKLTIFSLVPIPFVAFIGRTFGKKIGPKYMRIWRRYSSISGLLTDTIPGIRVISTLR